VAEAKLAPVLLFGHPAEQLIGLLRIPPCARMRNRRKLFVRVSKRRDMPLRAAHDIRWHCPRS
jgi:hypothetical protein